MDLKNSLSNAKRKAKENLPAIVTTATAIGSAAVVVYTARKINVRINGVFPEVETPMRSDFSLYLSGRESARLKSGIPRTTGVGRDGMEVVIATKDMLKDNFQELLAKTIFKD